MSNRQGGVTVGVDIGTTSVKAVAVDEKGQVMAAGSRVAHQIVAPEPDQLRHDARRAWRMGPRKAYADVVAQLEAQGNGEVAGVAVAAMVPSLTAVSRQGVPILPGLLYGDIEGRPAEDVNVMSADVDTPPTGTMPDAEGFFRWAAAAAPGAAGYWPCQAVATHAIAGVPAIDSGVTSSMGEIHTWGNWNLPLLESMGVGVSQLPEVVPMCGAAGTIPGTNTVFTGGSIDAFCDQIVAGAVEPGDVLVIFGATLIVWVVTDEWIQATGLISYPHTVTDRFLVGGPSNAGALFVDWARTLLRHAPRPGPARERLEARLGHPDHVPIWLPYIRGERTPLNDHTLRSNIYGLDIASDAASMERAAFEASGFVVQRIIDASGMTPRRIVASGGGSRVTAWMAAVADATALPVDAVAVPEGAARGAAFLARMAAGLETTLDDSARWATVGRRIDPDPIWAAATKSRYEQFCQVGSGD